MATKNVPIISPNTKLPKRIELVNPFYKSYAQIAALNLPKITIEKAWTEVTSSSYKQKAIIPNIPMVEPKKQKIIFCQEALSLQKSEIDLMLALNKSLQKAGILAYTRFNKVSYLQSGAISVLLIKKSSVEQLVNNYLNIIIRAANVVDMGVIWIEALKR